LIDEEKDNIGDDGDDYKGKENEMIIIKKGVTEASIEKNGEETTEKEEEESRVESKVEEETSNVDVENEMIILKKGVTEALIEKNGEESTEKEEEESNKVESKVGEIEETIRVDVDTTTTIQNTDEAIATLLERLDVSLDLELSALLADKDDGGKYEEDNDDGYNNGIDIDNLNRYGNVEKGEFIAVETEKEPSNIDLSIKFDALLESDGEEEDSNGVSELKETAPAPTATNDTKKELNVDDKKPIIETNSKRPLNKERNSTKIISKEKPSSSNQSQAKSSLTSKNRTTGSIKKVVASRRTLQVKEGPYSSKTTPIGRRKMEKKKEDRTLPKKQPKQQVSRDDAWYRKNGRTNSTSRDKGFSFMRSTECFSNYTSQTERLLKEKEEEKKRCAKKIIV
jgi:hypothetical protein